MPIYEYQCAGCHHKFELMQKINDKPVSKCPQCLQDKVVRLVSAAGFQLKGTGWYATDFKNNGTGKKTDTTTSSDQGGSDSKTKESSGSTSKGEAD